MRGLFAAEEDVSQRRHADLGEIVKAAVAPLAGFLGGIIAAGLAAFVAWRTNSSRMAADISARWDAALLEKSTDFVAAARSARHLAERYGRATDKQEERRRLDEAQERLRILSEQLRLVGNRRVQIGARRVQHHAYSVAVWGVEGRDPRHDNYPDREPVARLNDALQEFYRSVRTQLRARDAEDVIHDDELDNIVQSMKPLTGDQRASKVN